MNRLCLEQWFVKSGTLKRCVLVVLILMCIENPALADWAVKGEGNIFYTDDVSIFSASQRLSLQEDPTQPVIDITDQGDDVVFEPVISIGRSFQPSWGPVELVFKAQGFVFAKNSEFNHGTYGLHITQAAWRAHRGREPTTHW